MAVIGVAVIAVAGPPTPNWLVTLLLVSCRYLCDLPSFILLYDSSLLPQFSYSKLFLRCGNSIGVELTFWREEEEHYRQCHGVMENTVSISRNMLGPLGIMKTDLRYAVTPAMEEKATRTSVSDLVSGWASHG